VARAREAGRVVGMRTLFVLLCLCVSALADAQTLPTCATWQAPYGSGSLSSSTPAELCKKTRDTYYGSQADYVYSTEANTCTITTENGSEAFTFEKQCEPSTDTPSSEQYTGLMTILAGAFAVICFGLGFNSGWQA